MKVSSFEFRVSSQVIRQLETLNSELETSLIGVWCNASIRVLGTRGDSSILSSPTNVTEPGAVATGCCHSTRFSSRKSSSPCECKLSIASGRYRSRFCNTASLVQLVQDTALPSPRHRFESGTMLQLISPKSNVQCQRRETDFGHWT